MKSLTLNLRGIYFDQIKSGEKKFEYREVTPYWEKRLIDQQFDKIIIKRGYPKNGDTEKIIERPWAGFHITRIRHEHFGYRNVTVFAIAVN